MSKSLGNFVTIRELLNDWSGDVIRYNMLRTHYRQPIDWTISGLEESEKSLAHWLEISNEVDQPTVSEEVSSALADDLNSPRAISELHSLANRGLAAPLVGSLELLGITLPRFRDWKANRLNEKSAEHGGVDALIAARIAARKEKDFAEADRIRDELDAMGIQLMDSKDPESGELVTTWEVKR